MTSVLVATAQTPLRDTISAALSASGITVCRAATPGGALRAAVTLLFDVAVIEHRLATPEVIASLRDVPCIRVSSPDDGWTSPVWALESLAAPVDPHEVHRAVTAALRHTSAAMAGDLKVGDLLLHGDTQEAERGGASARFTQFEFKVLWRLAESAGRLVSLDQLVSDVWGHSRDDGSSGVVRTHIKNIRRKLKRLFGDTKIVATIPSRGYRLNT